MEVAQADRLEVESECAESVDAFVFPVPTDHWASSLRVYPASADGGLLDDILTEVALADPDAGFTAVPHESAGFVSLSLPSKPAQTTLTITAVGALKDLVVRAAAATDIDGVAPWVVPETDFVEGANLFRALSADGQLLCNELSLNGIHVAWSVALAEGAAGCALPDHSEAVTARSLKLMPTGTVAEFLACELVVTLDESAATTTITVGEACEKCDRW